MQHPSLSIRPTTANSNGQLSLAIPPWVGAMSTSDSWKANRHTARCSSPVFMVSQCKLGGLAKGQGNGDHCRPILALRFGKGFVFTATCFSNVAVMGSLDVRPSVRDVGEQ